MKLKRKNRYMWRYRQCSLVLRSSYNVRIVTISGRTRLSFNLHLECQGNWINAIIIYEFHVMQFDLIRLKVPNKKCGLARITMRVDGRSRLPDVDGCTKGYYHVYPFMKEAKYVHILPRFLNTMKLV